MGEYAELILDGTLCQVCGEYLGESGFPQSCPGCQRADKIARARQHQPERVKCPTCGKRVKAVGLGDHVRDVHTRPVARDVKP